MTPEARKALRGWHRLQQTSSSCVAACHAIIDARRGGKGLENAGYPALSGEILDPSLPESLDLIVTRVRRGELAIVSVSGPGWMHLARLDNRRSKYGDLGEGLHAIVVFAAEGQMLVTLDPYFLRKDQPVQVSRDNLVAVWSGQVEFVEI